MDESALRAIPLPELLPHGQHVGVRYEGGAWGASTDTERAAGGLSGTLKRFKKRERASDRAQAFGWIKATYRDAIEYSGMRRPLEGAIMIGAFFGAMLGLGMMGVAGSFVVLPHVVEREVMLWEVAGFTLLGGLFFVAAAAFTSWMLLTPLRHVWRAPRDLPIVFDRAKRRVYRIVYDKRPGLAGLFKPWPVKVVAHEWDLIDAEHDAQVMGSTATVSRLHRLVFVVRKSEQDATIIDHFEIGNGMAQGEEMIAPMWEHIRRFMEERGPHLPTPSEPLDSRSDDKPTWWQACGEAGPFGSRYGWWWKNHPILTGFYHVIAGVGLVFAGYALVRMDRHPGALMPLVITWIIVSINWGHGTGRWLAAHTSRLYDWPQEVKDAVGAPTAIGSGWERG